MALTKAKKHELVSELSDLLQGSKMTVVAAYEGTPVKAMQELRRQGSENGTKLKVVKNRLVIKALASSDTFKDTDVSELKGMLLYAFNANDEVAPAQTLDEFAKTQPTIQFVGAIDADGTFMPADEVKALAKLPSKNELIAGIINTLNAPKNNVMSGLQGNLHGLLDAVAAKQS